MSEAQKNHLETALKANVRFDGRKKDEIRKISIETGVVATAEGSARVKIGNTEVLAGIKMDLITPYSDEPDSGSLMVNAEFLPMASPEFETGAPGINAIELARVVDRAVRESDAVDFKKLCIKSGEKAWMVIVDVCTINHDGNLIDAAALATLAAIEDAVFPELEKDKDGKVLGVDYKHHTKDKVVMLQKPLTVTVFKVGEELFVDPLRSEEGDYDSRLSIAVLENDRICSLQKGGEGTLSVDDTMAMVELAIKISKQMRKAL